MKSNSKNPADIQALEEQHILDIRAFWNDAVAGRSNDDLAKLKIWADAGPEPWPFTIELPSVENPDIHIVFALIVESGDWIPRPGLDLRATACELEEIHDILSERVMDWIRSKPQSFNALMPELAKLRDRVAELSYQIADADPTSAYAEAWQPLPDDVEIYGFWFLVKARKGRR
ncbi:hypothetical protein [Rhodospirillaceae bacterium SYSU D60014]|uniref:hypothetical protein n=1 Tax=Virgifigura deserti TaxID=2268457 RepID=UPI000E6656AE